MDLYYRYSESTIKPEEITLDTNHVRLVRNVQEELREGEDGEVTTFYIYEEATLTFPEFQVYINASVILPMNSALKILLGEEK